MFSVWSVVSALWGGAAVVVGGEGGGHASRGPRGEKGLLKQADS